MEASIAVAEPQKVGRKKKDVPSDYVAVKIPRDVYLNAKLVATLTGKEMALIIGDIARDKLAKMADEAFKASRKEDSKPKR